jgi:hypothetical protein
VKLFPVINDRGETVGVNPQYFELTEPWYDGTIIHFASGKQMNVRENYTDFCVRLSEYGPETLSAAVEVVSP